MDRGDEVKVTEVGADSCTVYVNGSFATLPRWAVRMSGDKTPEPWTAYTGWNVKVCSGYRLHKKIKTLSVNGNVQILEEIPDLALYVVDIYGSIGYMKSGNVSAGPYSTGGGGNSGGSEDWTPPILQNRIPKQD